MVQRVRSRSSTSGSGNRYYYPDLPGTVVTNLQSYQSCTDHRAKGNGHDLDIFDLKVQGGILDRVVNPPGLSFKNWQLDALRNPGDFVYNHIEVPGYPTLDQAAAKLLADTNPSRPVVDLPIAVFELREIPKLLKLEGDSFLSKLGSANLSYQFGIRPLINDLTSLLSFSDEVAKRQKELDNLARSGLRRKRQLWSNSIAGSTVRFLQSNGFSTGNQTIQKVSHSKMWGFVEWFPIDAISMMKADRRALAKKAVLGLTVDFSTAWNILPWSWLIDWCSNVGDILIAKRNIVGASHGPIRIMYSANTSGRWRSPFSNVTDMTYELTTKARRTVPTPTLSAQLPILSARQLSILASIGVTRRLPSHQ